MGRNVVEFRLAPDDVSAIRFGVSPGYELCHAVRALGNPQRHPLQWGWLRLARESLPTGSFDLLRLVIGDDGYMPDFLTSAPSVELTPELELERLAETSLEPLVVDLGKRAARSAGKQRLALLRMRESPERVRAIVAAAARDVWEAAIAPYWTTIDRLLRADIGARVRRTASEGLGLMIDTLHDGVSWGADAVRVELSSHEEVLDCRGSGLVLVPSVFSRRCAALTEPPAQPTLFYPALGVTETWSDDDADHGAALGALLGDGRARLLRCLQEPLSTTETAAVSELAISTASHHLSVLRAANLVDSRRMGAAVFHARTPLGDALVAGVR